MRVAQQPREAALEHEQRHVLRQLVRLQRAVVARLQEQIDSNAARAITRGTRRHCSRQRLVGQIAGRDDTGEIAEMPFERFLRQTARLGSHPDLARQFADVAVDQITGAALAQHLHEIHAAATLQ